MGLQMLVCIPSKIWGIYNETFKEENLLINFPLVEHAMHGALGKIYVMHMLRNTPNMLNNFVEHGLVISCHNKFMDLKDMSTWKLLTRVVKKLERWEITFLL